MSDTFPTVLASEHFVAYKIAMLGFIPALVRKTSRGVDLLATEPVSGRNCPIRVKAIAGQARRSARTGAHDTPAKIPLGVRAIASIPADTVFCFVDFAAGEKADVYVVPASVLKRQNSGHVIRKYRYTPLEPALEDMHRYCNNWGPLVSALRDPSTPREHR